MTKMGKSKQQIISAKGKIKMKKTKSRREEKRQTRKIKNPKMCYECDYTKYRADGRRGGYNHGDCRHGKKNRQGKTTICGCWCVKAKRSRRYKIQFPREQKSQ